MKHHSLIDKVYNPKNLVRASNSMMRRLGDRIGDRELALLHTQLREGNYSPQPPKIVRVTTKRLGAGAFQIPTEHDRIVQRALKQVIEPILEAEFLDFSFGYRPKRGRRQAFAVIDHYYRLNLRWALSADVESFFSSIEKSRLLRLLARRIADGKVLSLIEQFLGDQPGIPIGSVLSPLLSNVYLHEVDLALREERVVRYCDNYVILASTKEELQSKLSQLENVLQEVGLRLNEEKTKFLYHPSLEEAFL